jgi:hypothetical protein
MIFFLVTGKHRYTVDPFLRSWAHGLASEFVVVPYEALPNNASLPAGTYVFSDLERLTASQRPLVAGVCEQLARAGSAVRLVNHPVRTLRRYDLLRGLHASGANRFNIFRAAEPGQPWRYPVFLRQEGEHTGSLSKLISDPENLHKAVRALIMARFDPQDLLVVEFCDTKDESGLFRKYSAFRVGDRILPRHILFSRHWVLKDQDLLEPRHIEELKIYCGTNPHEHKLRTLFEFAGIEYGRIDYSMLDGAIQTWEINTNPLVIKAPDNYPTAHLAFHEAFAKVLTEAFAEIKTDSLRGPRIPITWGKLDAFGF